MSRAECAAAHTAPRCIGFGEREAICENVAGSTHSPIWCQECDDERRAHITAQLDRMTAIFEARREAEAATFKELYGR